MAGVLTNVWWLMSAKPGTPPLVKIPVTVGEQITMKSGLNTAVKVRAALLIKYVADPLVAWDESDYLWINTNADEYSEWKANWDGSTWRVSLA